MSTTCDGTAWHRKRKGEHHFILRRFFAANRCVEPYRRRVCALREHPRLLATRFAPRLKEVSQQAFRDTSPLVTRCYADFVDEEFGTGLVGMEVVHTGSKPDDNSGVQRNDEVVTRVSEK